MDHLNSSVYKSPGRQISLSASNSPYKSSTMCADKTSVKCISSVWSKGSTATATATATAVPVQLNRESDQLQLHGGASRNCSVSLSSSELTNIHSSRHPANSVKRQQSMDQLLERLKDEVTELGNQGDAYTAQILSMYATFEDLMHNNKPSPARTGDQVYTVAPVASVHQMANVSQLRESFELTLLKKLPSTHNSVTPRMCSSMNNNPSSAGSSRKSSSSSIESTVSSASSSSSTLPSGPPVKSPRKSLQSSSDHSPRPIPQPRMSRADSTRPGDSTASLKNVQVNASPLPLPVTTHSINNISNNSGSGTSSNSGVSLSWCSSSPRDAGKQSASLSTKYASNGTLGEEKVKEEEEEEVSEDGHFVGRAASTRKKRGDMNAGGVGGISNGYTVFSASSHGDSNGVVNGANNNSGVGGESNSNSSSSSISHTQVRPSKQPLVTPVTSANCDCCSVHPCSKSSVTSTAQHQQQQQQQQQQCKVMPSSIKKASDVHSDTGSCGSINNSLLDTISTLRAPYSDTEDDEEEEEEEEEEEDVDDDNDDCDNDDEDELNERQSSKVLPLCPAKVKDETRGSQEGKSTANTAGASSTSSSAGGVTSVSSYPRNLLRTKRKNRKSQLIRSRSPCHLSSSDGDSITGGYAGSNSIDSGYKSFCPTPDQVSDSSIQSNDSTARAKMLLGSKKKSMTLGCNVNIALTESSTSRLSSSTDSTRSNINSLYSEIKELSQETASSHTGDKVCKSGTLIAGSVTSSGLYACKMASRLKQQTADSHLEHLFSLRQNLINAIHRVGSSSSAATHSNTESPIASRGNSPVVSSRSNSPAVTVIAAARAAVNNHPSSGGQQMTMLTGSSIPASPHHHPSHNSVHHHASPSHHGQFYPQPSPLAGSSGRRFLPQTPRASSNESIDCASTKVPSNHVSNDSARETRSPVHHHQRSPFIHSSAVASIKVTNSSSDGKSASTGGNASLMSRQGVTSESQSSSSSTGSSSSLASTCQVNFTANANQPSSKCVRFDKDVRVTSFAQISSNAEEEEEEEEETERLQDGQSNIHSHLTDASSAPSTSLDSNKCKASNHQQQSHPQPQQLQQQHLHKESINAQSGENGKSYNYSNSTRGLHSNSVLNSPLANTNALKASLGASLNNQQLPLVHASTATTTVSTMTTLSSVKSFSHSHSHSHLHRPHHHQQQQQQQQQKQHQQSAAGEAATGSLVAATKSILRDPICESMRSKVKSGEFTNDTSSSIESQIDSLLFGSCFNEYVSAGRDACTSTSSSCATVTLEPFCMRDDEDIPYVTMIEEKYRTENKVTARGDHSSESSSFNSTVDTQYGKVDRKEGQDVSMSSSTSSASCYESNGKSYLMMHKTAEAGENEKSVASKFVQGGSLVSPSSSLPHAATANLFSSLSSLAIHVHPVAGACSVSASDSRSGSSETLIINQALNHQSSTSGFTKMQCNRPNTDAVALSVADPNNGESRSMRERVERIINERCVRMQQQPRQQNSAPEYSDTINFTKNGVNSDSPVSSVSPGSSCGAHNLTASTSDGSMTPASSIADSSCLSAQSSTDEADVKCMSLGVSSSVTSLSSGQSSSSTGVIVPSATISAILDKHLKRNKKKATAAAAAAAATTTTGCTSVTNSVVHGNYTDTSGNGQSDMASKLHTETPRCPAITLSTCINGNVSSAVTSNASAAAAAAASTTSTTTTTVASKSLDSVQRPLMASSSNSCVSHRNSDLESVHSYSTLPELHIYEEVAEDNYHYNPHEVMYSSDQSTSVDCNRQSTFNRQSITVPFVPDSSTSSTSHCHLPSSPIKLSSISSQKRRGNIFTLMRDSEVISSSKLSLNASNDIITDSSAGSTSSSAVNECEYGFEATV